MNELIIKDNIKIEDLIYEVRGKQVMLDSDLAILYGCKNGTKDINKAVNRNKERFPEEFMFRLTKVEYDNLRFQNGTSKNTQGGRRYNPYVFTEAGISMLASILHSETAIKISIQIIKAFVAMRKYISSNLLEQKYINNMVLKHETSINLLQESFQKFEEKEKTNHIFFEGQIYDAYSLMMDILDKAKEEIIIIDNYAGKELFDLLKDIKIGVKVYSKNFNKELISKYNKQYSNITVYTHTGFHDRFIILDKNILYHCGSSFKDLGVKCFAINKIDNIFLLNSILNYLESGEEDERINSKR